MTRPRTPDVAPRLDRSASVRVGRETRHGTALGTPRPARTHEHASFTKDPTLRPPHGSPSRTLQTVTLLLRAGFDDRSTWYLATRPPCLYTESGPRSRCPTSASPTGASVFLLDLPLPLCTRTDISLNCPVPFCESSLWKTSYSCVFGRGREP